MPTPRTWLIPARFRIATFPRKRPALTASAAEPHIDRHTAFVHQAVVKAAEQNEIGELRRATRREPTAAIAAR